MQTMEDPLRRALSAPDVRAGVVVLDGERWLVGVRDCPRETILVREDAPGTTR